MNYIDVIFNLNVNEVFTYLLPEEINKIPEPGQRVLAPFGRRTLTGVITGIKQRTDVKNCKHIIDVLDDKPLVNPEMLEITRWMSEYYLTPWGQTVQLALPRGVERHSVTYVTINPDTDEQNTELTEKQRFLFDIIHRDPGKTTKFYQKKFGVGAVTYFLRILQDKNLIRMDTRISNQKVNKATRKFVKIADSIPDDIKGIRSKVAVIETLKSLQGKEFSIDDFFEKTGFSRVRIKKFAELNLISIINKEHHRKVSYLYNEEKKQINLNTNQRAILSEIKTAINSKTFKVMLIHGVTGSGKTQVYLESIAGTLRNEKTAIVLIPEISLTPQTVRRFEDFFPEKVAVFHSKMSLGERYDTWYKVAQGIYPIVVGPRSALFMPLINIGMIVVDEEHDNSYKQTGSQPRYHARDVAIYRAKMNKAIVLLGSATPSMESYTNACNNKYHLLSLPDRIKNIPLPHVSIVDMRRGRGRKGDSPILSSFLLSRIEKRIQNNEQTILLQNRRGFSSFVQCIDCGYIPQCPNCAIALTFHSFNNTIQCHYCGYSVHAEKSCMKCAGLQLKYMGSGTQKVEKELKRLLPQARIMRMDQDTTSGRGAHDKYLQAFREGKSNILLGTQMISKGLDFPNVTLVGVISADIGLSLPDFRASERVFQLLTQVAGRAGRDELTGEVVIQSYLENHYAIQYAREHDFIGYYNEEIKHRRQLDYPPHTRVINIRISGADLKKTIQASREIGVKLRRLSRKYYQVIGPAPCPLTILKNQFRWQLLLKLNMGIDPAGKYTKQIINKHMDFYLRSYKTDTKVVVDVDPVEML